MLVTESGLQYTCRCCARHEIDGTQGTLKLQSLYAGSPLEANDDTSIAEIFAKNTTRLIISTTDELPKMICLSCVEKVQQMQQFLDMCVESEKNMRSILENAKGTTLKQEIIVKEELDLEECIERTDPDTLKHDEIIAETEAVNVLQQQSTKRCSEVNVTNEPVADLDDSILASQVDINLSAAKTTQNPKDMHVTPDTDENLYKCKYCKHGFSSDKKLVAHLKTHLGNEIYNCALCPSSFRFSYRLRTHYKEHKNDDVQTRERNLIARRTKDAEIERQCKAQGFTMKAKAQSKKDAYRKQQSIIAKMSIKYKKKIYEKPFSCDGCDKSFKLETHLNDHRRIHTNEKPYKCENCDKAFSQSAQILRHLYTCS